ncbi:MAG: hypothetical protein PUP93_30505 [Rhizonema sp. NSF051]|nr:hypothetical protein [Rhizonema sp. NSF051]
MENINELFPYSLEEYYPDLGYQQLRYAIRWLNKSELLKNGEHYIDVKGEILLTQQAMIFWKLRVSPEACLDVAGRKIIPPFLPCSNPMEQYKVKQNISPVNSRRFARYFRHIEKMQWAISEHRKKPDSRAPYTAQMIFDAMDSYRLLLKSFVDVEKLRRSVDANYKPDWGRKLYFAKRYQKRKTILQNKIK